MKATTFVDTSKQKYVLNALCDIEFKSINLISSVVAISPKTTKRGKALLFYLYQFYLFYL